MSQNNIAHYDLLKTQVEVRFMLLSLTGNILASPNVGWVMAWPTYTASQENKYRDEWIC